MGSPQDAANQRKHDVGFREATTVFGDPLAATFPDIELQFLSTACYEEE
jgi:uncharacterized DUF497 family protein